MIGSSGDSSSSLLFALQEALRIIHRAFIVHCALLTGFLQLWTGASSAGGTRAAAGGFPPTLDEPVQRLEASKKFPPTLDGRVQRLEALFLFPRFHRIMHFGGNRPTIMNDPTLLDNQSETIMTD